MSGCEDFFYTRLCKTRTRVLRRYTGVIQGFAKLRLLKTCARAGYLVTLLCQSSFYPCKRMQFCYYRGMPIRNPAGGDFTKETNMSLQITKHEFYERLMYGESPRTHSFTRAGTDAIHEHLTELDGAEGACDKIAIRCEFAEDTPESVLEETGCANFAELQDKTWAAEVTTGRGEKRIVFNRF